jgi:large subunit ribosomal protein L31
MKSDIHPEYHTAKVTCSCGNSFEIGATVNEMRVEICANCHPFYTGSQKLIDTAGRLERFQARLSKVKQSPRRSVDAKSVALAPNTHSNKERLTALKKKLIQTV